MKLDLLTYLRCPAPEAGVLGLDGVRREERLPTGMRDIRAGTLVCGKCGRSFPIVEGIPRLLPEELAETTGEEQDYALKEMRLRNEEAPTYEDWFTPFQNLVELPLLARQLRLTEQSVVLDLGCGTGRFTRTLYRTAATRIIAMDLAFDALMALQRSLQPAGLAKVDLVQASATQLPLRRQVVDAAGSAQVLSHIPEQREAVFAALAEVLRPGGRFACTVHNFNRGVARQWPTGERRGDSVYMKFFRPTDLATEMGQHFAVERVFPVACREGRMAGLDWLGLLAERVLERTGLGLPTARLLLGVGTARSVPRLSRLQSAPAPETEERPLAAESQL